MIEKCEELQSELNTFWPEWQVIECFEEGASGEVFRIRKDSFGIRMESLLKVIRYDESEESNEPIYPAENNESEENLLRGMTETRTLFSSPDEIERWDVQIVPEPSSVRNLSLSMDRCKRYRKENDRQKKEDLSAAGFFLHHTILATSAVRYAQSDTRSRRGPSRGMIRCALPGS